MGIDDLRENEYYLPKYKEEIPEIQFKLAREIYKKTDDIKVVEIYQDDGIYIYCYVPYSSDDKHIEKTLNNIVRSVYKGR